MPANTSPTPSGTPTCRRPDTATHIGQVAPDWSQLQNQQCLSIVKSPLQPVWAQSCSTLRGRVHENADVLANAEGQRRELQPSTALQDPTCITHHHHNCLTTSTSWQAMMHQPLWQLSKRSLHWLTTHATRAGIADFECGINTYRHGSSTWPRASHYQAVYGLCWTMRRCVRVELV